MADLINSKIFKFKLFDVSVTVTVDGSFSAKKRKQVAPLHFDWLHYHAEYELFITGSELIKMHTEDGVYEYRDIAVCVPPRLRHRAMRNDDFRLFFDFTERGRKASEFASFMNSLTRSEPVPLKINSSVSFCAEQLYTLLDDAENAPDEVVSAVLKMLFYNLYRENYVIKEKPRTKNEESYLVKIDLIIAKCEENITLGYVAKSLGLSTRQTSRVIMKYYNSTLSELVTNQRLNVARHMLLSGEHSVSEIVEAVNFSSESYFYLQFKKKYGTTPRKYVKANRKNTSVD